MDAQVAAPEDVELLLKPVGHFALPLEGEVGRAEDEHALDEAAQFQLLEQQPRHDGLPGTGVVGQQEAAAGGL